MERQDLYQDDLTEERDATPEQRDRVAGEEALDPDTLDEGEGRTGEPMGEKSRG